jgi:hypothetical protein
LIAFGKPKNMVSYFSRFWGTMRENNPVALYRQKVNIFASILTPIQDHFFNNVLPFMQNLALQLPTLFSGGLKLLLPQQSDNVVMTQEQAACLLANGFFGTFSAVDPVPVHAL